MAFGIEDMGSDRIGRSVDPMQSYIEILRGRAVLGRVVDRENSRFASLTTGLSRRALDSLTVTADAAADTLRFKFGAESYTVSGAERSSSATYGQRIELGGISFILPAKPAVDTATFVVRSRDAAIDRLYGQVSATPRKDTDIIDVTVTDLNAERAQRLVNAIVEANRAYSIELAQERSRKRRVFLEQQLASNSERLREAQLELSNFRSGQRLSTSREKLTQQQDNLAGLEIRVEELNAERRVYRDLLAGVQRARTDGSDALQELVSAPGLGSNTVISQLYGQLVRYETLRDSLTTSVGKTNSHPDVVRVNEVIALTRSRILSATRSHVASLDARAAGLSRLRNASSAEMQRLPQVEAEEVRLVQDVEAIRLMGTQIRSDLQKAEMAEAIEVGQIEVLDLAPLPQYPSSGSRSRKMFFLVALGMMAGAVGAFGREALDTSVRRRSDLARALGQPELGMIPRIDTLPRPRGRRIGGGVHPVRRNGATLVSVTAPRSPAAEAYRTLRTNLIFSHAYNAIHKLVITSASPQEGKSTTAANLAIAFAQQGITTVLVDADLRAPTQHTIFGVSQDIGVTTVLEGRDQLERAVRSTRVDNLWLLASGPLSRAPAELVGSKQMRQMLDDLTRRFTLVILDTPPVLAAADASILAAEADGVVMVIRAGGTDLGVAQHALQQLEAVNARVLGAVLNDPDAEVPKYGEYDYAYGYASAEAQKG
jgi:capsular exopolysaccharide synthesis family protein